MKTVFGVFALPLVFVAGDAAGAASAPDKWPTKPIRMIVPFTPGSASDVMGRILAQRLGNIFGQPLVIDNRPGAGGMIGSQLARDAAPDGYTIAMIGQPHLSNALMREIKPYEPLKDFAAISEVGTTPNVIVLGKGMTVKTIPELIALAKAQPGALNYGSAGVGSSSHLAGAMFASKAKIVVTHVPFGRGGDSRGALISGAIQYYIYPLSAIMPLIKAGTLRALAVGSERRAASLPDVPTTAETGFPQFKSESWFGLIGPRQLPMRFVNAFNADTARVLNEAATHQKFSAQGAVPRPGTPAEFEKMQRDEYAELGALIREIGMKVE